MSKGYRYCHKCNLPTRSIYQNRPTCDKCIDEMLEQKVEKIWGKSFGLFKEVRYTKTVIERISITVINCLQGLMPSAHFSSVIEINEYKRVKRAIREVTDLKGYLIEYQVQLENLYKKRTGVDLSELVD